VGRSDDVAGSAHLLRPAGHGSVRSRHGGRAADLGAVGRQHHRVLDDLGSSEAVLLAVGIGFAPAALFAATHPSRTTALVVLGGYADAGGTLMVQDEPQAAMVRMWGSGKIQRLMNPDMPWNEEIRATWARMERLAASPANRALLMPLMTELDVRAVLPTIRVPTLVVHHAENALIPPAKGRYIAEHTPDAKYVELPGRNWYHQVEPGWRESFQEVAEFLTGEQTDVADDRVLATVLFTDIVDSTRRAAQMGDRDWHALLDAHDAVVRSQLARFRGREVNTSGDGFLADVRRPSARDPLRHVDPRRGAGARHRGAGRVAHRRMRGPR